METGTLKELNVKPGDVVEYCGLKRTIKIIDGVLCATDDGHGITQPVSKSKDPSWRIVSRAPGTPKLWRYMTPEEKGSLLLAHHEGEVIECWGDDGCGWIVLPPDEWGPEHAYRVRPEPKRETVTLWVHCQGKDIPIGKIDLIDGKPDPDSIRMDRL